MAQTADSGIVSEHPLDLPHDFDARRGSSSPGPRFRAAASSSTRRSAAARGAAHALGVVEVLPDRGDVAVLDGHQLRPHVASPFQRPELVDVDGPAQAVDGHGQRQRHRASAAATVITNTAKTCPSIGRGDSAKRAKPISVRLTEFSISSMPMSMPTALLARQRDEQPDAEQQRADHKDVSRGESFGRARYPGARA